MKIFELKEELQNVEHKNVEISITVNDWNPEDENDDISGVNSISIFEKQDSVEFLFDILPNGNNKYLTAEEILEIIEWKDGKDIILKYNNEEYNDISIFSIETESPEFFICKK